MSEKTSACCGSVSVAYMARMPSGDASDSGTRHLAKYGARCVAVLHVCSARYWVVEFGLEVPILEIDRLYIISAAG